MYELQAFNFSVYIFEAILSYVVACTKPAGMRDDVVACTKPAGMRDDAVACSKPAGMRDDVVACSKPAGMRDDVNINCQRRLYLRGGHYRPDCCTDTRLDILPLRPSEVQDYLYARYTHPWRSHFLSITLTGRNY